MDDMAVGKEGPRRGDTGKSNGDGKTGESGRPHAESSGPANDRSKLDSDENVEWRTCGRVWL